MKKAAKSDLQEREVYSYEEVNELAEWIQDLTLKQAFFLKESYEAYLNAQINECGSTYVQ